MNLFLVLTVLLAYFQICPAEDATIINDDSPETFMNLPENITGGFNNTGEEDRGLGELLGKIAKRPKKISGILKGKGPKKHPKIRHPKPHTGEKGGKRSNHRTNQQKHGYGGHAGGSNIDLTGHSEHTGSMTAEKAGQWVQTAGQGIEVISKGVNVVQQITHPEGYQQPSGYGNNDQQPPGNGNNDQQPSGYDGNAQQPPGYGDNNQQPTGDDGQSPEQGEPNGEGQDGEGSDDRQERGEDDSVQQTSVQKLPYNIMPPISFQG